MKVTVAATIRLLRRPRRESRHRRADRPRGGAAGREHHPDPGAVRDAVFLHRARPEVLRRRAADRGEPGGAALQAAGARVERRAAGQRVRRARRQRVLQLGRNRRCRRCVARHVSQDAHSGEPWLSREVLFLAGRHGFKAWRTLRHDRRRDLLGPVVSPSRRARWRCSAPRSCSIRRPSARSRRTSASIRAIIGSARCRVTQRRTSCRSSHPIASAPSAASVGK